MFDPVDPKQRFPALEHGILTYWEEEAVFKRSLKLRAPGKGDPFRGDGGSALGRSFSFYDGPPFATGLPHYGHLLAGTIKDVIPRYRTMRGDYVERRFGWDCHGLPVENLVEQENSIRSKREIEEHGIKWFNDLCRGSVQRYTNEWRKAVLRMGRWVDMDFDYRTMDPPYMESIWWVFQKLYEKGLIYEGWKSMHTCPRCVTPLSNFEVTQGYTDRTDLSVIVTFPLQDDPHTMLLAWTTTPWSLPGNLWLAVGPQITYVKVQEGSTTYILAEKLTESVFADRSYRVVGKVKPEELLRKRYQPLFPYFVNAEARKGKTYGEVAFTVVMEEEVSEEEGTGIVHLTSSHGEDGFRIAQREKVDVLHHITMDNHFRPEVSDFKDLLVKPEGNDPMSTDTKITAKLKEMGRLFAVFPYRHSYPHCWRCESPLLNYTTSSWFVAVEKIKDRLLANNAKTEWVPAHIRDGRFGKWLEGARDWAISRSRYWGTPLPIWRCQETGAIEVIGSRDELMERNRIRFTKITTLRHGQSEGNVTLIYQGKPPGTNLTQQGREQAKEAGKRLATSDEVTAVTTIYTSPLARAMQTAEILAEATGARVIVDDRIREVAFGEYEGKPVNYSDIRFLQARRAHKLGDGSMEIQTMYHLEGMERWKEMEQRTSEFLRDILGKHRGEHIVIVTHADPLLTIKYFFTHEGSAKICRQPYPKFCEPLTFYWDHSTEAELDLHKETVDRITWAASKHRTSVSVTLIRHGETDMNREERCQGGELDPPLNDAGREQAHALAKKLKRRKFDVVLSSPTKRALETAEIIAEGLGIKIIEQWDVLSERRSGAWSGRQIAEVLRENPPAFEGVNPSFHHATPEDGESLSSVLTRATRAQELLRERYPGKCILVVTHRGFIQAFRTLTENLSYREGVDAKTKNIEAVSVTLHPFFRRIPEVLDCWFESGSMPYAHIHYPFVAAGTQKQPAGFPADFIAEGIDQTRGWFYTLMVLSTALFDEPAFIHCVVNGTVLAEDGRKMSKRLKNYPEPMEIVEKYGADAIRFALMESPAVRGEDLRFSERLVEEALRNVLLPFWNTYAFFVTYANAAKWEPIPQRTHSVHPLDRWIRAEVQDLVNRMTAQLDGYDLSATCAELHDTIDALTNWYVRLSRRRFAGKIGIHAAASAEGPSKEQQHAALQTLYDVLLTLAQLLAPFCPFLTEAIYLNLVPEEHGSVHLTDWPETRALSDEERRMIQKTRVLRTIVSLGLKVRAEQKIKIRQPLRKAVIAVPPSLLPEPIAGAELTLLQEELNVKGIEVVPDPGALARPIVQVDPRKVGPRLGPRVQEVIEAGKRGDFSVSEDGTVLILEERLTPDEATILYRGNEGEGIASDHGIVVSLDTAVTEDLRLEGQARELIRMIQQLRKDAGLSITDRIALMIKGVDALLEAHGAFITQETNAIFAPSEGTSYTLDLDSHTITITFHKVGPTPL